jgi:hemolysin activation/secretion protein
MMIRRNRSLPFILGLAVAATLAVMPAKAQSPTDSAAAAAPAPHRLRQILIADTVEAAQQLTPNAGQGFVVVGPQLEAIDSSQVTQKLAGTENQPIDEKLLSTVTREIEGLARQHGFSHATAIVPSQNIGEGAVRIALLLNPPVITRIVIGAGADDVTKLAATSGDFLIVSPRLPPIKTDDLAKRLAPAENKLFQEKLLAAVAQVVEIYFRQHDYPIATATIPPQNAKDGSLRVAVELGRIRNIKLEGNRWFSDSLLREKLRIEQGAPLQFSQLDSAISWTNNNPFRRVKVQIEPVAGTGEADLIVAVQEAIPLRASFSYDNAGNSIIGNNRFTAGVSYANAWGKDHQVSYQFVTTDLGPRIYQGHGVDYHIPLASHDDIQFSASYLLTQPSFYGGLLAQKGESITGDLRYSHPFRTGDNPINVFAGLDFKQTNNNLAFGGTEVLANKTDIFQLTTGASLVRRDKRGAWAFAANVNLSPGHINSRNADAAFNDTRVLASPTYVYGQISFQRLLNLEHGWDFTSRGLAQIANKNLLPSEQFYIGGGSSVRGFRENVFGGDEGFLFTNELYAPKWERKLPFLPKNQNVLETRLLAFYDAGQVRETDRTYIDPKFAPLASTGFGVRMSVAANFSLSADYGWQITHLPYAHDDHGRGHVKVTLAF